MKQLPLYLLMIPFTFAFLVAPVAASAKDGEDDMDDDADKSSLEVEAHVYTDTTIVKVENNDKKSIFATTADTREEVVGEVAKKFDRTENEVDAALEFSIENHASRPQDRGKLNKYIKKERGWGHHASSTPKVCRDDDVKLKIRADVFTDKTVVKVEFVNAKDVVFATPATTSADIVKAIAERYTNLSTSTIEAALAIDVENRASRVTVFIIANECKDGDTATTTTQRISEAKISHLRARIAELQTLLDRLTGLLRRN